MGSTSLLEDKVVLITGSSGLLGSAMAKRFLKSGATVIANYSQTPPEYRWESSEKLECARIVSYCADVTVETEVEKMIKELSAQFGKIDVLVNNAFSGFSSDNAYTATWPDVERAMSVMVHGALNCVRSVIPVMKSNRGGKIINIGSTSLWELNSDHLSYMMAKGSLSAMSRSVARDFAEYNITSNVISPGLVWPHSRKRQPKYTRSEHVKRTPLGRLATPLDIANVALFMASPLSDFITGVELPVCGGLLMS